MKRFLALMVAMGAIALTAPQEAQAQHWHRGGSGFAISIGNGGFGGFNPYGFGGFGHRPAGFNVGYSSFRPSYGYSHYRPSYGYRGGYSGYRGGYRGGCGW